MIEKRYWNLKLIGRFYGTVLPSKRKLFSETLYLGDFSPCGDFPSQHDTNLPSSQLAQAAKTAGGQCILLINGIMYSENASKEMVKSFRDLANVAKGLMDKNHKSSVEQDLESLSPSTRDEGRWKQRVL